MVLRLLHTHELSYKDYSKKSHLKQPGCEICGAIHLVSDAEVWLIYLDLLGKIQIGARR